MKDTPCQPKPQKIEPLDWGNRCGHIPDMPDLTLRFPAKMGSIGKDGKRRGGIPGVLPLLLKRLEQYYWKPAIIPSLNLANGSRRQQRSERREGCVKLLAAMTKYTDLTTLKVGIPQPSGDFHGMTIRYLASQAGISFWRASRAIRDLQRAGLVTVATRAEPDGEGGFRGIAAVKAIRKELFTFFGLDVRLKHERKSATERQAKKREAWQAEQKAQGSQKGTLADLARLKTMIQGLMGAEPKKRFSRPTGAAESVEVQENRAKAARLRQITEERPDLSPDAIIQIMKNEVN